MKNVILLIFTPDDLAFLPEAIKRLRAMAIEFLWVLHTPQLGLPYPASARALDDEIESTERDKQRASMAENFDDAAKYRDQANALRVKRELEIKNAYTSIPAAQILAIYDKTFADLNEDNTGIPNIVREALPDPIGPDAALGYLAGRGTDWYDQFPHGEYAILWVRALPELQVQTRLVVQPKPADANQEHAILHIKPEASTIEEDSQERSRLNKLPYFTLKKEAVDAGVETAGRKKTDIIEDLLTAHQIASL